MSHACDMWPFASAREVLNFRVCNASVRASFHRGLFLIKFAQDYLYESQSSGSMQDPAEVLPITHIEVRH